MASPFYIVGDSKTFCIVDAIDHTSYHFQIQNDKLCYIHDQQQYLVISETVSYTLPYYSFSILVAYKEPSLEAIKQRPVFDYELPERFLYDEEDRLCIQRHRCGAFLPQDPFTIYSDYGNDELISTLDSPNRIRACLFRKLIIDHLMDTMPCQTCNQKYSRDACETTIAFSLYNYKIEHKCVACATKDDGVFDVSIENFTIRDKDVMYQFRLDKDGLYLINNNDKSLVVTHELHESMNDDLDDGSLHQMVYKYKLTPVVIVNDRLIPEDPDQRVFGIRKSEYFRDTLIRLLHTQLCVKCKTSRNLKGMSISEKEYFVHGHCQPCSASLIKEAMNAVFSHTIKDHIFTIILNESNTVFEFELRHNKIWYQDKLVLFNGSGLKLFDDLSQQETHIVLPNKTMNLGLSPIQNLVNKTSTEVALPYQTLFEWMLGKITNMIPCQWCNSSVEDDRISFVIMTQSCYSMDVGCKSCWKFL